MLEKFSLSECVEKWYDGCSQDSSASGFDVLASCFNCKELVACLCDKYFFCARTLADMVCGADSLKYRQEKGIKTIGMFYQRYGVGGGVERVISILMPLYIEMGYKVVFFTDEVSEKEYDIPSGVVRVVLPSSISLSKEEYGIRADEFIKGIKDFNIDLVCYHGSTGMMLFDILLLKLNNIPVIVTSHLFALHDILTFNDNLTTRPSIFRLADCVTVLSKTDEVYYKSLGVNAIYLPNPITCNIIDRDLSKIEENTIVWVGRLDYEKQPLDAIDIMTYVVKKIPNAKLLIIGNEYALGIKKKIEKKIRLYGLENNIVLCGATTDVERFYKKAELLLFTSACESFSMVIAEAKSYGIPVVMYELPFLELCRDKNGILAVPQGDKKEAAKNIISILTDSKLKACLQKNSQESIRPFLEFDLKKAWASLFKNLSKECEPPICNEYVNIILQSLLQNYDYGVNKINKVQEKNNGFIKRMVKLPEKIKRGVGFCRRNGIKKTVRKILNKI